MVIMTSLLPVPIAAQICGLFHSLFFSSLFCRTRREIIIVSIIDLAAFMQAICNMVFIEGTLSFFLRTQTSQTTQSNEAREKPNTKNSCSFISSLCDDDNSECARLALQRRWREKKMERNISFISGKA